MSPLIPLRVSIKQKVVLLSLFMLGLCAFLVGSETFFQHINNKYEASLIHPVSGITKNSLPFFNLIRYVVSAAILSASLILGLRALRQIDRIFSEADKYARQLDENSSWVQQILEALPVGMVLIDANQTIRQINKTALDLMQVTDSHTLIGKRCKAHFCSIEVDNCPLALSQNNTFCNETYLKGRKGINPFILRNVSALTLSGKPMVLETLVDISERKQVEQALIEKQNFINKVLEAAAVAIVVVDCSDYTIVEANPAAVEMIGAPRPAIIGSHCRQWLCQQQSDGCPVSQPGHFVEGLACQLCTPDGGRAHIVKNVAMVMLNDRIHLVESFIDITPLKDAEEKVKRLNAELEQRVIERTAQFEIANKELKTALQDLQTTQSRLLQSEKMASIGQLAAGVAHEINNPVGFVKSNLHAIDGYRSDLMQLLSAYEKMADHLRTTGSDDEVLRQHLLRTETIMEEIDLGFIKEDFENVVDESAEGLMRVVKIVGDLKSYSYRKADEAEWADLNAGIESTLNIVWNKIKHKAAVTKALGALPLVRCFSQLINQVIMNLLLNAYEAIEDRGCIHIMTASADNQVTITIRDEGKGILPEHMGKVFDPFFTTKEVGAGTGLGLSVAYNIVKRHKGRIQMDSKVGQGTTVTIRLPVDPAFETAHQLKTPQWMSRQLNQIQ